MTATRSSAAKVTLPTDDQILITREFDTPRRSVYQAWTTPDLVKRWWSRTARRGDDCRDRPASRWRMAVCDDRKRRVRGRIPR